MSEENESDKEIVQVEEGASVGKKPFPTVFILIGALVVVLLLGATGTFLGFSKASSAQKEVLSLRKELKARAAAVKELQAKVEEASLELKSIKESAAPAPCEAAEPHETPVVQPTAPMAPPQVQLKLPAPVAPAAHAAPPAAAAPPAPHTPPVPPAPQASPKPPVPPAHTAVSPASAPAQERKPAPEARASDCQLVGKSPEEQAATLKRCVSAMEVTDSSRNGRR